MYRSDMYRPEAAFVGFCAAAALLIGCSAAVTEPASPRARAAPSRSAGPSAEETAGSAEETAGSGALSADQVRDLVDAHNRARAAVRAPALSWSAKVAQTAQAWAATLADNGCDLKHSSGGPYGENLYWSSAPQSARNVVGSWTDEAKDYNVRKNKCARGQVCGHYTQVVWADSRTVGCAKASCGSAQVWVCNYDPPGNFVGQKPF